MALTDDVRRERFDRALGTLSELFDAPPAAPSDVLRDARGSASSLPSKRCGRCCSRLLRLKGWRRRHRAWRSPPLGVITEGEEATAWDLLRYRNLTTHTCDEALALDLEQFLASHGLPLLKAIAGRLDKREP